MKIFPRIKCQKGFTLVELLVTITIIISLMGIAFVAVAGARSKAKQAECVTNLKDLWSAGKGFADDWNGRLPANNMPDYPDSVADESIGWMAGVAPYLYREDLVKIPRLDKKFRCPLDTLLNVKEGYLPAAPENVSYVPWTDGSDNPADAQSPINISRGYDQVSVPWLSDGLEIPSTTNVVSEMEFLEYVEPAKERHDEAINVLYVGGAVKAIDNPTFDTVAPYGASKEHMRR